MKYKGWTQGKMWTRPLCHYELTAHFFRVTVRCGLSRKMGSDPGLILDVCEQKSEDHFSKPYLYWKSWIQSLLTWFSTPRPPLLYMNPCSIPRIGCWIYSIIRKLVMSWDLLRKHRTSKAWCQPSKIRYLPRKYFPKYGGPQKVKGRQTLHSDQRWLSTEDCVLVLLKPWRPENIFKY